VTLIRRLARVGLLGVLLAGCTGSEWTAPTVEHTARALSARELDVAEAAFRYLFEHYPQAEQPDVPRAVFCIAWRSEQRRGPARWSDTPPQLVRRLANLPVRVLAYSRCGQGRGDSVFDVAANRQGIAYALTSIRCRTRSACVVDGGYRVVMEEAASYNLDLILQNGRWVVTRDQMNWIT
jgi:hypothetical protein